MDHVDLVVAGSVAVTKDGARLGKGGGYSDLEYSLGRSQRIITEDTPILTTVHHLQIISQTWEIMIHDIPVDFVITPDEIIATHQNYPKPEGIYWDILRKEMEKSIPVLERFN